MSDDEGSLLWEVVVQVGDDLDRHISLSCPWGSHHHGQPRLHARPYRLNLGGGEGNLISEGKIECDENLNYFLFNYPQEIFFI